jgi:hypothetical protein
MPAPKAKKIARPPHKAPAKAEEQADKKKTNKGGEKPFDNKNRAVLFVNEKDGNEARPDFTGTADIEIPEGVGSGDVVKFRLSAWKKESKNGTTFLSISVQVPKNKEGSSLY